MKSQTKIKICSKGKLRGIMETRTPFGKFLALDTYSDGYPVLVAMDNSTGDAWTEEFNDIDTAVEWLRGDRY